MCSFYSCSSPFLPFPACVRRVELWNVSRETFDVSNYCLNCQTT
nr:MAG TPA: hypothetical protein [Caudoviricetes sp.]